MMITKNELEKYCELGLTQREIAAKVNKSHCSVRYWLKKYDLATNKRKDPQVHFCTKCGEKDPNKFYGNRKRTCGRCHNRDVKARGQDNIEWAIAHKGGGCQKCGYDKCMWALQFHHLDPDLKDPNFKGKRGWGRQRWVKELDNCILLCANCHLEEHERLQKLKDTGYS